MVRRERPGQLARKERQGQMVQTVRRERPVPQAPLVQLARPAQLLHLTPTKETAAVSILLRVFKPSSASQPAATTRPLVIKRSLASLPAAKRLPLDTKR